MTSEDIILERYADKVTPDYRMAMQAIGLARHMLAQHRQIYDKLIESKQHMDSVGGLLDPTLYRDMIYSKNFAVTVKLVEAARKFLSEVDKLAEDLT